MNEPAAVPPDRSPTPAKRVVPGPVGGGFVGLILGAIPGTALWLYEIIAEMRYSERPLDFKPLFFIVILAGGAIGSAIVGAIAGWIGRRPELVGATGGAIILGASAAVLSVVSGGELELLSAVAVAGGAGFVGGLLLGATLR